jgi:hemolysin activation/secretion protein
MTFFGVSLFLMIVFNKKNYFLRRLIMNRKTRLVRTMYCIIVCVGFCYAAYTMAADSIEPTTAQPQPKLEAKAAQDQERQEAIVKSNAKLEEVIAQLDLPQDTSPRLTVKEIRIIGNTLISTDELLANVPPVYNASDQPLLQAESKNLFDLRALQDVIIQPGQPRKISSRAVRGFTKYVISVYGSKGYAGIFAYVPSDVLRENKLRDDILIINVTEAPVTSVTTNYYTPENEKVEEGYLKTSFLHEWLPIAIGEVGKQKELNDFIDLLNLNPDRYISATVSKGAEPDTLAVGYNIYEANPWHYFLQVDNAGTDDRQWTPRVGLINTNLTGIDDRLTVFYQAPWSSDIFDEYSLYGSYDFPIMGPKLRLELYAGYSQFDVDGGAGIGFLGHGSLYGGKLRYNAFQKNNWFFDLTTSLSREKSKVSSSIFSSILGSEVEMDLWGIGFDIHKRSDMSNTSITFDRVQRVGGSPQKKFWDPTATPIPTGARTNADRDFAIYTIAANHSRYLNADKIQRLTGSLRWIIPDERLVPAKMTTFGGMYSVRGYKESRIVADGGVLASVQYEYDLIKHDAAQGQPAPTLGEGYEIKKLAPLVFFDFGQAKIKDRVAGEKGSEELYSIGVGTLVELGENFSGAIYYGYPLESTDTTDTGQGRINISLMMRW